MPILLWFVIAILRLRCRLRSMGERAAEPTRDQCRSPARFAGDFQSVNLRNHSKSPVPELAPRERPASVPYASSKLGSEPGPSGAIRVVFTATEPVWVSIQSDGNPVYTGMLEQQHNKELAASTRMTALVGNAGGLEVSLNGKAIGPIGQHGEVRVLELTPAGAHITRPTE